MFYSFLKAVPRAEGGEVCRASKKRLTTLWASSGKRPKTSLIRSELPMVTRSSGQATSHFRRINILRTESIVNCRPGSMTASRSNQRGINGDRDGVPADAWLSGLTAFAFDVLGAIRRSAGALLRPFGGAVVPDARGRDGPEHLLEALQVARASDLRPVGEAEDEVAEAEVPGHEVPELLQQEGRSLQRE